MNVDFRWLDEETIARVHTAALSARLSRDTLLRGLPVTFTAGLAHADNPSAQLLSDLRALNETERLDGAHPDHAVPLRSWLKTADHLSGPRIQAAIFREALAKMDGGKSGTSTDSAPRAKALWDVDTVSELWQHSDTEVLLKVMKNCSSPLALRSIAAQAGFDVARVHFGQDLQSAARELIERSFRSEHLEAIVDVMIAEPDLRRWSATLEALKRRRQ